MAALGPAAAPSPHGPRSWSRRANSARFTSITSTLIPAPRPPPLPNCLLAPLLGGRGHPQSSGARGAPAATPSHPHGPAPAVPRVQAVMGPPCPAASAPWSCRVSMVGAGGAGKLFISQSRVYFCRSCRAEPQPGPAPRTGIKRYSIYAPRRRLARVRARVCERQKRERVYVCVRAYECVCM